MRSGPLCFLGAVCVALTLTGCSAPAPAPAQTPAPTATAGEPDRTVLPIAEPKPPTYKELDARNAKPPARFEVKAPQRRTERRDRADRRRRLRRAEHVRRPDPHADDGPARAGGPALQQLPHDGAVLADAQRAQDRTEPPHRQYRLDHGDRDGLPRQHRAESRTASRRWRKCCGSTATAPAPSASGTKPPPGRPACRARSTAGPRTRASTSSTDSSAARPTSGIRSSTTA